MPSGCSVNWTSPPQVSSSGHYSQIDPAWDSSRSAVVAKIAGKNGQSTVAFRQLMMVNMENGWTLPGTSKNWQVTTVNVHCVDNFLILVPMNGWPRSLLGNVLITLQHGTCHISPTTYLPNPTKIHQFRSHGLGGPLEYDHPTQPAPKAGFPVTHPQSPKWSPHALWDIWANTVGRRSKCSKQAAYTKLEKDRQKSIPNHHFMPFPPAFWYSKWHQLHIYK